MGLETANVADFEELVGHKCMVVGTDLCELQLDKVDLLVKREESTRQPFALVFKGALAQAMQLGTFELQHEQLGALHIFLVPIDETEDIIFYEAVFN